jgi:hypothetical protein
MYVTHIENNAGEFFFFVNNAPVPIRKQSNNALLVAVPAH